jgi:hypothetical protein
LILVSSISACSTPLPSSGNTDTGPVPVTDVVQAKLAPQPSTDPTLAEPLAERRCDFNTELKVVPGWFSVRDELTPDGRIALARAVLGPTASCQKIELVSITVIDDGSHGATSGQHESERRAEDIRRFFMSRGVNPERIEASSAHPAAALACVPAAPCSAEVNVWVRGVAR